MEKLNAFLLSGLLAATSLAAPAQVITDVGSTAGSQMPGSPTDFTFIGSKGAFGSLNNPSKMVLPGTTVLTDFSVTPGSNAQGIYAVSSSNTGSGYSTISAPAGYVDNVTTGPASVQTAVVFNTGTGAAAPDLATFTLGSSTSFNYSDFNVFVMFSNYDVPGNDADIDLTLVTPSGNVVLVQPVTDDQSGQATARFEEFHITGAVSGEQLEIGATSTANHNPLIGGVSFEAVPEPSTWAMLLGSLALLVGIQRFRKIA